MMQKNKPLNKLNNIDGRTILLITICSCFVSFLTSSLLGHAIYTFWIFCFMCYMGCGSKAIKYFSVYIAIVVWIIVSNRYHFTFPSPLFISMVYKVILPAMPADLLSNVPFGKLTAGIRKLHIPSQLQLIAIVMLRFTPTVFYEIKDVKEAMRVRGFLGSASTVIKKPIQTLEYAFVPLIMRTIKIADELAASASVRGIESPYKKESYFISKFQVLDYFMVILTLITTIIAFKI